MKINLHFRVSVCFCFLGFSAFGINIPKTSNNCDTLEMVNGTVMVVSIEKITSEGVWFGDCGSVDGSMRIIKAEKIKTLRSKSYQLIEGQVISTSQKRKFIPASQKQQVLTIVPDDPKAITKETQIGFFLGVLTFVSAPFIIFLLRAIYEIPAVASGAVLLLFAGCFINAIVFSIIGKKKFSGRKNRLLGCWGIALALTSILAGAATAFVKDFFFGW